ncbi:MULTISPECIES: HNH endonuclease [Lacticaseibacillus]|uniref:Endodeoxyribonuclease n=1 Tax=Lacticaseibacillus casei DSM 20011 = JCM 1134 = ATCC 393 TaxID=1423732 RepID=A0AAD1ESR8_LACCA|nr:HNH endonuclease [Lacticaseibacillus casei]MBI6598512.1 HNH endonuclease [Lacticaseibacillus casei]MBO1482182.1 HNH endonuclease [Lacticaseibacillus casei]MBO2417432.1 HNH endonuclease [Lacticaseibacillus casei]MCK2081835.1 HNH endonuclease [Lacticaseibacillus casei]MED7631485.1 HNH endonuclease [Lacticaseibacillus casei]
MNTIEKEPYVDFEAIAVIVAKVDLRDLYQIGDKLPLNSPYLPEVVQCPAPFSHYAVSQSGMVYSRKFNRPLLQRVNNCGYKAVHVVKDDNKALFTGVHRLIALTFCDNKWKLKEVSHIDDNKLNNCASNLEFITRKDNLNKVHRQKLMKSAGGHGRSVRKVNDDGSFQEYRSIKSAAEANGLSNTSVAGSANGTLHLNKPFYFSFVK